MNNPRQLGPHPLKFCVRASSFILFCFFFFNDTATTEMYTLSYTLSLHDALPISPVTFRNLVCRLLLVTGEIGRAHVRTPVTFRNLVCRILLEKKKKNNKNKDKMTKNKKKIKQKKKKKNK